ncbi:MAG: hypothetical protein U9R68_02525 [Planctomycetota bacterium]|nr:hypothetical protein [Planctomycetota bacterium]
MAKRVDIIKIKQDRGQIIINLDMFYPTKVYLRSLYRTICGDPTYDESLFQKDIMLLEQLGLIELSRNILDDSDNWWKQYCLLTGDGKQIAEGTKTHEALEI